ncbi:threonylcarbamoyl-AMP synthase [bacterium (Candidatus Torokbacteria) CG_4_10_14_0_2_um_filter_35_8]|nr:MAG: threonylcarbamoyl-AMP synthase [bacterium (Candidatus Torokbacteria) CG_4_10_14_0_2_um_filter_35_8]
MILRGCIKGWRKNNLNIVVGTLQRNVPTLNSMRILKVDLENPEDKVIEAAADILKRGLVLVYPTDTVYGLGVNILDENAVRKIFLIKGRDFIKPLPIVVRDLKMAEEVASVGEKAKVLFNKFLPGPLTLVLPKKDIISDIISADLETVGIRIPECEVTKKLSEKLDFPYTTTSANISGRPSTSSIREVRSQFSDSPRKPDLILNAGTLSPSLSSTIVDLSNENDIKILREGPISKEEILSTKSEIPNKF